MAKIRLAAPLQTDSIVDGEGLRAVVWTQGCIHNCEGCHNPETHDLKGGYLEDIDNLKKDILALEHHDGITLSGGDPFVQIDACLEIATFCKENNLNIWCYTGYTFEQLMIMNKHNKQIIKLLEQIDVLIDGKFILAEKSYACPFRGSKNQRVLDVKESLKANKAVILKKYRKKKKVNLNAYDELVFI